MKEKENIYKQYLGHKRYLNISRLVAALIGIFVFVYLLSLGISSYLAFVVLCAVSQGLLWYIVIDNKADKYEERLIDYEMIHKIKTKKK